MHINAFKWTADGSTVSSSTELGIRTHHLLKTKKMNYII